MNSTIKSAALTVILALVFGFAGAAVFSWSGLGDKRMEEYLLANPDILPRLAEAYQAQETEQRMAGMADDVAVPFPGAVIGNPNGSKVLVEFADYNCGYCKLSQKDVARLVEADPDLKIVIREWPIFQGSEIASRMALAAAKQGKYAAFHEAMYRLAPTSPATIEQAAKEAGLDFEQAKKDANAKDIDVELAKNAALAQQIGFTGTPSWVIGKTAFEGAVGFDRLQDAIDQQGT